MVIALVGLVSPSQGRQVAKRQGVMGGESGEEEQQGRTHTGRNFLHNRLYQLLQNAQFNSIYWVEAR